MKKTVQRTSKFKAFWGMLALVLVLGAGLFAENLAFVSHAESAAKVTASSAKIRKSADSSSEVIVKYFSALIILRRHTYRRNSCITCSLQALHRLVVADDTDDLHIGDLARCDSINDRLQIRSAAGYQYDYS